MPTIINQSFFIGELQLPNLTHQAELDRINIFIIKYEPECLLNILGYPLFKLFGTESSQRMTDLLSGAEFTDGEGNMKLWKGIKHDTTISLIANYVYFYFMEAQKSQFTGAGTATAKPEAGFSSSPADKMTKAWNFFSEEVHDMTHFLWMKKDNTGARVYPEFSYHQFFETRNLSRKIDSIFSL